MSERKTLGEHADQSDAGGGGSAIKLVGACLLVLGAVGVLGWGLGLFGGGPKANTSGQSELSQRFEEQETEERQRDERDSAPSIEAGG